MDLNLAMQRALRTPQAPLLTGYLLSHPRRRAMQSWWVVLALVWSASVCPSVPDGAYLHQNDLH